MRRWPIALIEYAIAYWYVISLAFAMITALYLFISTATLPGRVSKQSAQSGCLDCGYDLTENTTGVCPECGRSIPL